MSDEPEFLEKLWAQIDMNGPVPTHAPRLGPCHVWVGTLNSSGYGVIARRSAQPNWRKNRMVRVHRVVWELEHGPIPAGMVLLHECDVRRCVRHLRLGTQTENIADMRAKGRSARGEKNGCALLTEDAVRDIRRRFGPRGSGRALAREFGVSAATISMIVNRKLWDHV